MRLLTTLMVCALAAGCATTPGPDCVATDWHSLGIDDGLQGYAASRLTQHVEHCSSRPDHSANVADYEAGRAIGLARYCTVENGLRAGKSGRSYRHVCPEPLESEFLAGYYLGAISLMRR